MKTTVTLAREARDHEADNTNSMPVSMAQPRSLLPRVGQMRAICRDASGPVAVAMVRP